MWKSYLSVLILVIFSISSIQAQPRRDEAKQRIQMMKKMKLLEILDLSEEEADKFLIKYNAWENKISAQNDLIEEITDELEQALKNEEDLQKITLISEKYINEKIKFQEMVIEKLKDLKSILNLQNYSKLLIFEERFYKELGRMMWRMGPGRGKGRRR